MGSKPTALVTREELDRFCRHGRLAATKDNRDAGALLKEHLEGAGFTALAGPVFTKAGLAVNIAVIAVLLVAVALPLRDRSVAVVLLLAVIPTIRLWHGAATGTPAAVYGIRKHPQSVAPPGHGTDVNTGAGGHRAIPTVILCAHYDSTSALFPFRGSAVGASLRTLAILGLATLLGVAVHPVLAAGGGAILLGAITVSLVAGNASPGADDNASGVFAVLECVRRFGHLAGVNVVPVFFNFEEQGLFGSRAWVRRHFGRKGIGLPGVEVDPRRAWVINFDCVGRGRRVYISGNRELRERLLRTASARAVNATRTFFFPSDHLAFRSPWKAVSFARADRFWAFSLGWVHSKKDAPSEIKLENLVELSQIVGEFLREVSCCPMA